MQFRDIIHAKLVFNDFSDKAFNRKLHYRSISNGQKVSNLLST